MIESRIVRCVTSDHRRRRDAITLIEVIFSIGVMLIGLVGLVAIIPVAGQQSQDAISATVGSNLALSTFANLQDRRLLHRGRIRPIERYSDDSAANDSIVDNFSSDTTISFCFDPMFASATSVLATPAAADPVNSYNQSLFPYYDANFHIFRDPSQNIKAGGYTAWPSVQPRMSRAGLTRDNDPTPLAANDDANDEFDVFVTAPYAREFVESVDDLIINRPADRSLPPRFQEGGLQAVSGGLTYGKRITSGRFSWFTTVNPFGDSGYASTAVIVLRNRLRLFDIPDATTPPSTPDGNAIGERIAYVTFGSGFSGGAGGLIHIVCNDNVVDDVNVGDWLMMSKFDAAGDPVHRWYRVLSQGGKAQKLTTVDGDMDGDDDNMGFALPSGGPFNVWRRKLLVEGSDWAFDFVEGGVPRNYADSTFGNNTYVTLVQDVAGVVEQMVPMDDL